jgi:fructosamine-3-kinase
MTLWSHIAAHISEQTGTTFEPHPPRHVGGGCINQAARLSDGCQHWFVKTNGAGRLDMFEAEAEGLNAMADTHTIRVPRALCTGRYDNQSYIVIEYIEQGQPRADSQALAGRQLAAMHRHRADAFGWHRDNTIGATPQANAWNRDWIAFWREQRLGFQLRLAAQHGYAGRLQRSGEQLLARFPTLIDHAPQPSLLHGDLWGGNITFDPQGRPAIFDPAVYYGDREADLAMTELFGGFDSDFYAAYREAWPLDPGYRVRRQLYNLYHVLNHLNLFGGGYGGQAQGMIDRLLAQC